MSFENLLAAVNAEQEELKKSQSDEGTDQKIQAAADEDGAGDDPELAGAGDNEGEGEGEGDGAPITKSFRFTLEGGEVIEAEDGTELVKSLMEQIESDREGVQQVMGATLDLVKSMGATVRKQSEMIKSLQGQIASLSTKGTGRKAVLTVTEKQAAPMRKSLDEEPQGMTPEVFMAKSMDAFRAGKITSMDVARVESHINHGSTVPEDIVSRVLAATK